MGCIQFDLRGALSFLSERELVQMEQAAETAKELLVDVCPSVAEVAEHHALVGVLGAAMERLPARERLVLEGVTIAGAPARTMADTLGVTPAQIYRLQKNGIRRVRGMLSRFMQHWSCDN